MTPARHLTAGVPWPVLLRIVHALLQTGGAWHELDDALTAWRRQNPTRTQGAR